MLTPNVKINTYTYLTTGFRPIIVAVFFLTFLSGLLPAQIGTPGFIDNYLQDQLAKGLVFDILKDRRGLMWFGTEYGLVRYDGYELRYFQYEPGNPYSLSGNVVTCLLEDKAGHLWVGTLSSGLHRFDPETERFTRFSAQEETQAGPTHYRINDLAEDSVGNIWIATEGGGINRWNAQDQHFDHFLPTGLGSDHSSTGKVRAIHIDDRGILWAGAQDYLARWDPAAKRFLPWVNDPALVGTINAMTSDKSGRIWIGTRRGQLFFLEGRELKEQILPASFSDESDHTIHNLLALTDGSLWIGTDDGLIFLDPDHPAGVEYFFPDGGQVFSFCYSDSGLIWLGTNSGVIKIPLSPPKFQRYRTILQREGETFRPGVSAVTMLNPEQLLIGTTRGPFLLETQSLRLHRDLEVIPGLSAFDSYSITTQWKDSRNGIWLATLAHFDGGFEVFRIAPDGTQVAFSSRYELFGREVTRSIAEDRQGNIWFGTSGGLICYDPRQGTFKPWKNQKNNPNSLPDNHIRKVFFDREDRLWLGSNGGGLALYRPASDDFQVIKPAHGQVIDLVADTNNTLWLATQGGLNSLDPKTLELTYYTTKDGLPDNTIKSLCFDRAGTLWIGTKNGFASFRPEEGVFHSFNRQDGIQHEEYWERVNMRDPQGRLFFGGAGGFNYFHPDSLPWNTTPPPVLLTDFQLFNQTVLPLSEEKILPKAIGFMDRLVLQHQHKVMTFRFSALNYYNPAKNRFAFQLEGFDPDWQYVGDRRAVTYTNLDPGQYTFRVKASNNDGVWNEQGVVLALEIRPPWFASGWAYLAYVLLLGSGIYFFYQFQLNRQLAEAETKRLRELDTVKTQLYTNITHEFRTPLTLIQGPVEKALETPSYILSRRDLERIRQNCRRLLHLIRQMLHLNKLEAGAIRPNYAYGDVLPTVKYIVDSFSSFAESRQIKLQISSPDRPLMMDFDPKKLVDILSNLVSNAVKFTSSNGKVVVEVSQSGAATNPTLEIRVRDTGRGIPAAALHKIFDRFYQVEEGMLKNGEESVSSGSGIGLALSKKLTELMEGSLTVNSVVNEGSTFLLRLPMRATKKEAAENVPFPEVYVPQTTLFPSAKAINPEHTISSDEPTVLIVEDNADVANFVAENIPDHFQVHICANGAEGVTWALDHIPDLIISDVMMPLVNGYELTRQLKTDLKTSHIPIILLTARADLPSKLTGFERGADAYMAKPFNSQELLTRIDNLLESRRRLQEHYLRASGIKSVIAEEDRTEPLEHSFLKQVRTLIEAHLDNGNYSIEDLAGDLFMSTAQLYRKMKALTGFSPSNFFRSVQITKARQLLSDSTLSISEVAYQSGFNDPAYFSRVFTAETGLTPTAYRDDKNR